MSEDVLTPVIERRWETFGASLYRLGPECPSPETFEKLVFAHVPLPAEQCAHVSDCTQCHGVLEDNGIASL